MTTHNAACNRPPQPSWREGRCPSCGRYGRFRFEGEQHWPRHITERIGLPSVVLLWSCVQCHSTISDNEIA